MRGSVVVAMFVTLSLYPSLVYGQLQEDQISIQKIIGEVDLEQAAVFVANRYNYANDCKLEYRFEGLASGVSRLQYGAMNDTEKAAFKEILPLQVKSTTSIIEGFKTKSALDDFCFAINLYLNKYIDDFMLKYPSLFD